jgi:hypothetical protein
MSHIASPPLLLSSSLVQDRSLPQAQVGDLFVIHDTGAHSHSMGFQYNGKLRAPELLVRAGGKRVDLIRGRETIAGLFANTSLPTDLRPDPLALPEPYPYDGAVNTNKQASPLSAFLTSPKNAAGVAALAFGFGVVCSVLLSGGSILRR